MKFSVKKTSLILLAASIPQVLFSVATLDFDNDSAKITINSTRSSIKIGNVAKVNGWSEQSIVKNITYASASNWKEAYSSGTIIGTGGTTPATHLLRTTSNAVNLGTGGGGGSLDAATAALIRNNSYLLKATSNAVVKLANSGGGGGLDAATAALIRNNSYILRGTSQAVNYANPRLYVPMIRNNSYILRGTSQASNYTWPILRTTSNAVLYVNRTNSNALNYLTAINTAHYQVPAGGANLSNIRFIKNGFTIPAGETLTLDTPLRVSGNLNFGSAASILELGGDLNLASDAYLTSGAKIKGNGHSLTLTSSFVIPAGTTTYINNNTIIDGNGGELILGDGAILSVDNSATLTLRNMTIRLLSGTASPQIAMGGAGSALTLQNVIVYLDGDYTFGSSSDYGRLYVQDDVIIRGTHTFAYRAATPMYIMQNSRLMFDIGMTFKYNPGNATPHSTRNLLRMVDDTSTLYFNGSTFNVPTNGVQLTNGNLIVDNRVYFNNKDASDVINSTDSSKGITLGTGTASADVAVYVLASGRLELSGYLDYNNSDAI